MLSEQLRPVQRLIYIGYRPLSPKISIKHRSSAGNCLKMDSARSADPKLTVLMPVYNGESYVPAAPAWDSRSVGGSSNGMAAVCGRVPTQGAARLSVRAATGVRRPDQLSEL